MKGLKKLVLATAVAAAPFAQAELTAMDDSFLEGMTGQAGITLDINLDMNIAEIRYADEDGRGDDIGDGGFLTLSNLNIFGDQGNGTQAEIKGVTIDVDGAEGIVIGFGEIGSGLATDSATSMGAVATGQYWTGVNITTDFGINGTQAGSLEIKNFTNFVPNALALEGVQKFGYDLVDTTGGVTAAAGGSAGSTLNAAAILQANAAANGGTPTISFAQAQTAADAAYTRVALVSEAGGANLGAIATGVGSTSGIAALAAATAADPLNITQAEYDAAAATYIADDATNGFASALAAGTHVDASVSISAGGAQGEGLSIDAVVGFVIQEMSFSDDGLKMGIHNFTMYDTDAVTGQITGFKVTGLKIDVVDFATDGFVATNSNATAALKISGLNTEGTIAMGDIFIGDHTNGSIGAVAIRDIDMSNTEILIYGH